MKILSKNVQLSLSLVCLTLFIFFVAKWIGYVPDEYESNISARIDLTESIAAQLSVVLEKDNIDLIPDIINRIISRNSKIQSIALRQKDGSIIPAESGKKTSDINIKSTTDIMKVPIVKNEEIWGILEVYFKPLDETYIWGLVDSKYVRLILFISIAGFVIYLLLISRVLKHLDPYRVIPGRVKLAFDSLTEGIALVDHRGSIVFTNEAFTGRMSKSSEELLGLKISDLQLYLADSSKEGTNLMPWDDSLKNNSNLSGIKLKMLNEKSEEITLIVNCTPLNDKDENTVGALISFNDMTEIDNINRDLESMAHFLRHEMRNALIGATSTIDVLSHRGNLKEEDKSLLIRAQQSHNIIRNILDSIKEAKNIESSFNKEQPELIRLDSIINASVNNYSEIYKRNQFIYKSCSEKLMILAKEERIMQMLDKLCTNAIEHSINGTDITVSLAKDNNHAVISVSNEGDPLPDDKHIIFDLFSSFRKSARSSHNQGIGLYVVRLIAEAYGGSVEARERQDVIGAEFIVTLPVVN